MLLPKIDLAAPYMHARTHILLTDDPLKVIDVIAHPDDDGLVVR